VRDAVTLLVRAGLALLFGYAAIGKLRDPNAFAREIANYQLLPQYAQHAAATLPATELVLALALWVPNRSWRRAAALALAVVLFVFVVAVTSVVVRGVNVDCGCFGAGSGAVSWLTVVRNLGLTAAALYLLREDSSRSSSSGSPPSEGGDGAAGVRGAGAD